MSDARRPPVRTPTCPRRARRSQAALALAAALAAAPALAEATVEGDGTALIVTADDDALSDVIAAVGDHLGIDVEAPEDLGDQPVRGSYHGTLGQVLRALMPTESFIVVHDGGDAITAVRFLGRGSEHTPPVARATARIQQGGDGEQNASPRNGVQVPVTRRVPPAGGQLWQQPMPGQNQPNRPGAGQPPPGQQLPPARKIY